MIVIKKREDLENQKHLINRNVIKNVEEELKIFEDYYGDIPDNDKPVLVIAKREEWSEVVSAFPLLNELESEESEELFQDESITITRFCYIYTDSGIVFYELKEN